MIGRLSGTLIEINSPDLLVEVNGVGYEVTAPMTTIFTLGELNSAVVLYTHLAVSENAQTLYGFASKQDRGLFRSLIKVSGVGPKMAVGILSGMESEEFVRCVMEDKVAALTKVPGVGKKTAERLVIEMRDRLKDWALAASPLAAMESAARPQEQRVDHSQEAESALIALGYKPTEASKMVSAALQEQPGGATEVLIRSALKSLHR